MNWHALLRSLLVSLAFAGAGILAFGAAFAMIRLVTPFSIRKEIEEDHNTALAVLIGSVIVGIAIIIAAAIHG